MSPYDGTARVCQAMASTVGGQRRILKKPGSVLDYIRRAVETGVYRTDDELAILRKERAYGTDDLRVIMQRFRQDIVRGSNIQDYPKEYLILEQHPPIPDPPRTPVKFLKQLQAPSNPVDVLTKKYLHRQQHHHPNRSTAGGGGGGNNNSSDNGPASTEEYYRRLLGVQAAAAQTHYSSLRQKPAVLQKAYLAAITHYQLQRTEGLSDTEAVRRVDALLAQELTKEQSHSRERTQAIQAVRHHAKKKTVLKEKPPAPPPRNNNSNSRDQAYPFLPQGSVIPVDEPQQQQQQGDTMAAAFAAQNAGPTLESIFSSSPRTLQGMMRWSERLSGVPYMEWTIGASTALDHWIARQVLGLTEETWQLALQGDDPALLAVGRDIIACREALFPETILSETSTEERMVAEEDYNEEVVLSEPTAYEEKETRSIEDLLQKLGELRAPDTTSTAARSDNDNKQQDDWSFLAEAEDEAGRDVRPLVAQDSDTDAKIDRLVHELQSWRRRNMETPYDEWFRSDKERFNAWMRDYVKTVTSNAEQRHQRVDYDTTREALLSEPPVTANEADEFWSQIQEQGTAAALLDSMVEDGPPPGATILQSAFWDLSRREQLERLLNLGALRPLLDEYTKESDRLRFLQRHGDTILAGVELEHLVVDEAGPVKTSDLSPEVVNALRIPKGARFRLEKRPYNAAVGDSSGMEKSRALFKAWNEHKAGRARYEEKLFQTGRLGLRYSDKIPDDSYPDKKT